MCKIFRFYFLLVFIFWRQPNRADNGSARGRRQRKISGNRSDAALMIVNWEIPRVNKAEQYLSMAGFGKIPFWKQSFVDSTVFCWVKLAEFCLLQVTILWALMLFYWRRSFTCIQSLLENIVNLTTEDCKPWNRSVQKPTRKLENTILSILKSKLTSASIHQSSVSVKSLIIPIEKLMEFF